MVEFAMVVGPLMLLLYGLIAFGMMFALKQSMTSAAADAARAAIGAPPGTEATVAQLALNQRLSWLGSKYSAADSPAPVVAACANNAAKQCITVKVNYPYAAKPLVPNPPGLSMLAPTVMKSEATVQIS
jgi:Flp pilus assembly protein TadG